MLTRPDIRVLSALASLEGHPEWQVVREWLEESLAHTSRETEEMIDAVRLRMEQGAAQTLRTLIEHQDSAPAALDEHRRRQRQQRPDTRKGPVG